MKGAYEKRALHWVASAASDAPRAENDGRRDGSADEQSINVANLGKGCDSPEKVDRARDDGCAQHQQANLYFVSTSHLCAHASKASTHHPAVSPFPIDEPTRNLPARLYDQQAAESLSNLKDGGRPPQQSIPSSNRSALQQPPASKDPLLHALVARPLPIKRPLHPALWARRPAVHRKLVQAPYQQRDDGKPLRRANQAHSGLAERRAFGSREAQDRVEEVVGGEGEGEGEAAGAPADVKGERDGEDDEEQPQRRGDDAEQHHLWAEVRALTRGRSVWWTR
jgi:hypothetical protein